MAQQATTPESYVSQEIPTSAKFNQLVEAAKQAIVIAKGEIGVSDIDSLYNVSDIGMYLLKDSYSISTLHVMSNGARVVFQILATAASDPNVSYYNSTGNLSYWSRKYYNGVWSTWSNILSDKADKSTVYTKTEVDSKLGSKMEVYNLDDHMDNTSFGDTGVPSGFSYEGYPSSHYVFFYDGNNGYRFDCYLHLSGDVGLFYTICLETNGSYKYLGGLNPGQGKLYNHEGDVVSSISGKNFPTWKNCIFRAFNEDLREIISTKEDKPFLVSINGTTKAADKTFAEVKEAYNAGKKVEFYVDKYTWDEGGSSGIDVISFKVDAVYVEYYTSGTGRFNAHTYVSYVGNDGATHYGHIFVEMKQDGTVNIVAKSDN